MTTIVNNPTPVTESENGNGFIIGTILLVALVAVLLYFGIPMIRQMSPIQVNVPAPQVEVALPEKVDVNVTQPN